jgi:AcrR family transcriptional regulator
VGNREALIIAARNCIAEKGYQRTTARDLATSAQVSLAAIGYHFGTTEALLNEAVFEGIGEWGEELARVLAEETRIVDGDPFEAAERVWSRVIASFDAYRSILAASYELMTRAREVPEVHDALASAVNHARVALASMFLKVDPEAEPERARQVGSLFYAILNGVLTQWLIDPLGAPSGRDLSIALRDVTTSMSAGRSDCNETCQAAGSSGETGG